MRQRRALIIVVATGILLVALAAGFALRQQQGTAERPLPPTEN
jgi:hypothetical protein